MGSEGSQRAAHGIEEGLWVEGEADMVDEASDAPTGGLRACCLADPAQHLLGAIGGCGSEATGLELGKSDALVVGEGAVTGLEDGPACRFGELALARFGLTDVVD